LWKGSKEAEGVVPVTKDFGLKLNCDERRKYNMVLILYLCVSYMTRDMEKCWKRIVL